MSVAIDTVRYCGEHITENIVRTPEGYLICLGAVIARSGFQEYAISEIDDRKGLLKDRSGAERIRLWRPPEQVFSPATIASFEGKTFTVTHPSNFLNPSTDAEHNQGQVHNVRKGDEPLDDGNWPLVADIFAKGERAINAIASGRRELSCGYCYDLVKNGERYEMHNIIGNHVALVDSGRAGEEARINDSASLPQKEPKVKNLMDYIRGLGFKEYVKATDDPEAVSRAIDAMGAATKEEGKVDPPESQFDAEKKRAEDDRKKAKDAEEAEAKKKEEEMKEKDKAKDDDFRKRMHDALEKVLEKHEAKKAVGDADLEELKKLWNDYLGEEQKEPVHAAGDAEELKPIEEGERQAADTKEKSEEEKKAEDAKKKAEDDKKKAEDRKAKDAEIVNPEPTLKPGEVPESQFDAAFMALKSLRPFMARLKSADRETVKLAADSAVNAFNITVEAVNAGRKKEVAIGGGYNEFLAASRGRARAADGKEIGPYEESPVQKRVRENDDMYARIREQRSRSLPNK